MFIWIYKLIKKDAESNDMIYIGSTGNTDKRWINHIKSCNNEKCRGHNNKVYKYIRDNGGIDEWQMVILDEIEVPLIKCEERDKYEDEYIKKYDAINKLNSNYCNRTFYEWRIDNRDKLLEKNKKYYNENRKLLLENKKIYRESNGEKIKETWKRYYENNREKIKETTKEKVSCEICGSIIRKSDLCRHQRSQKCINFKNLAI